MLALGRSGTHFLSSLLTGVDGATVHHEPHPYDPKLIWLRHGGRSNTVVDALLERRFAEMFGDDPPELYGEVNSYLRYEVDWLRRRFDPTLIHLVRDGRDFVRSAWIRDVYTPAENDGPILPHDDDPIAGRWHELDRFGRLCWYWDHTNRFLAERIDRCVQMEAILSSYEAFAEGVLEPTGLTVDRATWMARVARPSNTSARFRTRRLARRMLGRAQPTREPLPPVAEWDAGRRALFAELCGETMRRLGYKLDA